MADQHLEAVAVQVPGQHFVAPQLRLHQFQAEGAVDRVATGSGPLPSLLEDLLRFRQQEIEPEALSPARGQ